MSELPQCFSCAHFRLGERDGEHSSCAAFPSPERIPAAIWIGDHDHHEPYPGDHGIQFTLHPLLAAEQARIDAARAAERAELN